MLVTVTRLSSFFCLTLLFIFYYNYKIQIVIIYYFLRVGGAAKRRCPPYNILINLRFFYFVKPKKLDSRPKGEKHDLIRVPISLIPSFKEIIKAYRTNQA